MGETPRIPLGHGAGDEPHLRGGLGEPAARHGERERDARRRLAAEETAAGHALERAEQSVYAEPFAAALPPRPALDAPGTRCAECAADRGGLPSEAPCPRCGRAPVRWGTAEAERLRRRRTLIGIAVAAVVLALLAARSIAALLALRANGTLPVDQP